MVTSGMTLTDDEIKRAVAAELKWEPRLQPNEIEVIAKDGIVTLRGWADSYIKKWAAEEAALRVPGVKAVANDIEVRLPTYAERPDADLAAAVVQALESDAGLRIENLKVSVSEGWVTLSGEVEWHYQKEDATRVVRRLTGVRGITNLISVRPRSKVSPEAMKRQIEEALLRSTETDAKAINVEVRDDTVILTGTVHTVAQKLEAERIAWSAPGVREVDNRITIKP